MRADDLPDAIDIAVIGGGVIGCAVAATLARLGRSVVLLEAEARLGTGISSRNSGVIHSGLYYPPGSLKARACVRGQRLLYQWVAEHDVWHAKTGKLVVAHAKHQLPDLEALAVSATANGAPGVRLISGSESQALEPSIPAIAALHCPQTGIVDVHELVLSLRAAAEREGAVFVTGARLTGAAVDGGGHRLVTTRGELIASQVVNAAGLAADEIAAHFGVQGPTIHPCRGDYFRLVTPTLYRQLIYPVRDRTHAGLGIHLTLERGGGYRLGPDVTWVDRRDDFADREAAPLAVKHAAFHAAAERLLGPLAPDQLRYDGCGIRPKLRAPHENEEKDFVLTQQPPGVAHLIGIESPGLTAALDLAERTAALLGHAAPPAE